MIYPILRNLLFQLPPETAHWVSMKGLDVVAATPVLNTLVKKQFNIQDTALATTVLGIHFPNPIGLGAGFDKNALHLDALELIGFGFIEIGTVTPKPQAGNAVPRLFRIPDQKALINRMGFNNDGLEVISRRLHERKNTSNSRLIIGGNIGKNKDTANENAWKDYCTNFIGLEEVVDYFVVNVSSPNTPGLRALQEKEALRKIFAELQNINKKQMPILLKIAPDLSREALDDIISLTTEIKIDGLVSSNTTLDRSLLNKKNIDLATQIGAGGLSGQPLFEKSNEVLTYLHQGIGDRLPIIASGGIFNGEDAKKKMALGASLLQVWTGFIYEGPSIVKNIAKSFINDSSKK